MPPLLQRIGTPDNPARVFVVDDSAVVRRVLSLALDKHPGIQVIGSAPDPIAARDAIVSERPHVLILDLEMPRMDGIEFLKRIMTHFPMPVIIVSSLTPAGSDLAMQALELGAVDVLCKPGHAYTIGSLADDLHARILAVAGRRLPTVRSRPATAQALSLTTGLSTTTNAIIAIGASTGGTEALATVIRALPATSPGIVVVQHMPPGFTKSFADRLNRDSALQVSEAIDGDRITPGRCLIAPGDRHLVVERRGATYFAKLDDGPRVGLHKPAVNVLFDSLIKAAGNNTIAAILTGMGKDGASGITALRQAGAHTIGQNEATCVVYGMPKEAQALGGIIEELPIDAIAKAILNAVQRHGQRTSFTQ